MKEDDDIKWTRRKANGESLLQILCYKLVADGDDLVNFTNLNTALNLNPLLDFADAVME